MQRRGRWGGRSSADALYFLIRYDIYVYNISGQGPVGAEFEVDLPMRKAGRDGEETTWYCRVCATRQVRGGGRDRQTDRDKETETKTDRQRQRQRQRQTGTGTETDSVRR